MTFFDAIILGVVEGLTEFLPVSSTAHLLVVGKVLGLGQTSFVISFSIIIQLGAITAVVWLYGRKLVLDRSLLAKIITAFIPTAVLGFLLYGVVKALLLDPFTVIGMSLVLGGVVMLLFEYWYEERPTDVQDVVLISYRQALVLGIVQALAMIPGVSRSGATIIGGQALRLSRKTIVEFSFLLAIPTMVAATGYDMIRSAGSFSGTEWELLAVGFATSFMVSIVAIKSFLQFITRYSFAAFGVYRIIAGVLVLWLIAG